MCIQAWIFSFKLVEYFRCYVLFIASLIKADILRRHHWLLSRVVCTRNCQSFSFYRVISALKFYWSTFVCDTNITAVNWSLIESFRLFDQNGYEYEIFSILSSTCAWGSVLLAGKRGSLRHSTTSNSVNRDLTKPRRRRQRERKKTIGLMSKTREQLCTSITLFLYISLPSLHNYDVKWPNFKFTWEREWQGDKFYHLCPN